MKNTHILIALVLVAALLMVSCRNNKKIQSQELSQEEVQEMKQALADSVLAQIDTLAEQFLDASSQTFNLKTMELTKAEIIVKPDYLLDPSVASTLVTKSQKINALAIYTIELGIRQLYQMPSNDIEEVIAKLAADVNHPIDTDFLTSDATRSEKIRREYEICKERGDIAYFWQYQYALVTEISYILAQNPELYFRIITGEQWRAYCRLVDFKLNAIKKLAEYDEEMAQILEFRNKYRVSNPNQEKERIDHSIETVYQFHIANKDKFIAKRNALLQ